MQTLMPSAGTAIARLVMRTGLLAGLALAASCVFYLGVLPTRVIDLAARSIQTIF